MAPHSPHDDVYDIAVSPDFEHDRTIFALCRDMFLRSTDGGLTWMNVVRGLNNMFQFFTDTEQRFSLGISRRDKRVLFLASRGDGLYRSSDFGTTWERLEIGRRAADITILAPSPHSSDVVFAATAPQGLMTTSDGGATWESVDGIDTNVTALGLSPEREDDVFVGDEHGMLHTSRDAGRTWTTTSLGTVGKIRSIEFSPSFSTDGTIVVGSALGGVLKSTDRGQSFSPVNAGLHDVSISSVAFSPNYALDATIWVSAWTEGVSMSCDGGASWTHVSVGLTRHPQKLEARYDERPHFGALRAAGTSTANKDQTLFLAGFDGLFYSEHGGRSWRELETLPATLVISVGVSPNFARDSSVAVTTYINGAFLSEDRGDTWTPINDGLEEARYLRQAPDCIARLFAINFSPGYPKDRTLFCAGWTYFLRKTKPERKWSRTRLSKESIPLQQLVVSVSPDYIRDETIFMGNRLGEIYRSTDGGVSFEVVGTVGGHVRALVASPDYAADSTLFAATPTSPSVHVSVDRGETWSPTSKGLPRVMHLAVSPDYRTDRLLFAGTRNGLFLTADQGQSWERVGDGFGASASCIEALALSPDFARDKTVLVSISGKGLYKSTDGGMTFRSTGKDLFERSQVLANIPNPVAVPIVFSPAYATDSTVFGYSPTNVFRSTDGGETWSDISPPRTVHEMPELSDSRGDPRVSQPVQLSLDAPEPIAVLEKLGEASATPPSARRSSEPTIAANALDAVITAEPAQEGRCAVCGHSGPFVHEPGTPVRRSYRCTNCRANLRYRQQAEAILEEFDDRAPSLADLASSPGFASLDVYEVAIGGPIRAQLRRLPGYVGSYLWHDVPRGAMHEGARSEDLHALTFPDQSFDLAISSDVFEHVRHPDKAFAEIFRVLKPGGCHVFTVPVSWPPRGETIARVDTSGPEDVFILKKQYHPSPRDPEGALVYTDFGLDLPDLLRSQGFRTTVHFGCKSAFTFVSRRPRSA